MEDHRIRQRGGTQCECDGRCGEDHAPLGSGSTRRPWRCEGHHGMWRPGQSPMVLAPGDVGAGRRRCRLLLCPDCAARGAGQVAPQ